MVDTNLVEAIEATASRIFTKCISNREIHQVWCKFSPQANLFEVYYYEGSMIVLSKYLDYSNDAEASEVATKLLEIEQKLDQLWKGAK